MALAGPAAWAQDEERNPADPFEGFNRGVQSFNDGVDDAVLKPVATAYRNVVPQFARTAVGNFFGNLGDGWSALNHLLQGKLEPALNMTLRMAVNSTFGLGGLLDVASEAGLERQSEDFGQTLGVWGVPQGPYLVLPLLGPSTLRDATGRIVDMQPETAPRYTHDEAVRNGALALNVVDTRASLLGATRLLDDIALDRYSFLRDAYLARRLNQVYDGNPPEERFDEPK
ncbi:MAG: VacJ family lipoprotein [Burkholderiaceae bacterium]|nr:VacJ family lipoprotein [Burkholderiaceae bacterium]